MFSRKTTKRCPPRFHSRLTYLKQEVAWAVVIYYHFCAFFDTRNPAMSISTFFMIQYAIFCSYCFLPILKFDPVEQISVQFIFLSIIGIETLLSTF